MGNKSVVYDDGTNINSLTTGRRYRSLASSGSNSVSIYHDGNGGYVESINYGAVRLKSIADETVQILRGTETGLGFSFIPNFDQIAFVSRADSGYQFVFGLHSTKDFDHPVQTNPTIFFHSATDPDSDNTQWLSLSHDQTDAQIESGKGKLVLTAPGGVVLAAGAGDYVAQSANTERTTTSQTYVLLKSIRIFRKGTLRLKWQSKGSNASQVLSKIYRNGVAVGTEKSIGDTTYTDFSDDVSGWVPGDTVDLYACAPSATTAYVRNFQVCEVMPSTPFVVTD